MKKISIITPVYFNSSTLVEHAKQLREQRRLLREKYKVDLEVIYVNDGSGDDSLDKLMKIKKENPEWVVVVSLTRNFGSFAAIKAGLTKISGDCACYLSADLQDPSSLIAKITQSWLNGAKYVVCIRKKRNDPTVSKIFSAIFYFFTRRLVFKGYPSGGFDVFLMNKQTIKLVLGLGASINMMFFSYWIGRKPEIIYYEREVRKSGKSKWTFRKKLRFMIDSILGFSSAPVKLFSYIGLIVSFFSFLFSLFTIVAYIHGGIKIPGYTTMSCLFSFLFGITILLIVILLEYVSKLFDSINNKPEYIIDE